MESKISFLNFHNPSLGTITFAQTVSTVIEFMNETPGAKYKVMIGSDSNGRQSIDIVSVIAIHRVGNGGRYFWSRNIKKDIHTLRHKIHAEVNASLELAALFLPAFRTGIRALQHKTDLPFDFEIHVDVGDRGETRDLIREVTGMVRGMGYVVYVKPESYAATNLADRHVK